MRRMHALSPALSCLCQSCLKAADSRLRLPCCLIRVDRGFTKILDERTEFSRLLTTTFVEERLFLRRLFLGISNLFFCFTQK